MSFVDVIGVVSGILTIFSFAESNFASGGSSDVGYLFKVGLDGANGQLTNAGGNIPDITAFDEHGTSLGYTNNDKKFCSSGSDNCQSSVSDVTSQPTYTLFTGNNDAMCIAYVSVTFPGQDKYAWVGNWGQQCGAPWYYSDIYVQNKNGAEKLLCTWVDRNGDIPTTGFQVHWPDYLGGFAGNGNDPSFYCNNHATLNFRTDPDPSTIEYYTRKRDMFARNPSTATSRANHNDKRDTKETYAQRVKRQQAGDTRLVKSQAEDQTASGLCNNDLSVGPSFVSLTERKFCYMETKTVYPFCEDVETGQCWNDTDDTVIAKGDAIQRRADIPTLNFTSVLKWGLSDE